MLFINGFGVYNNMYYSLMGIYMIFSAQSVCDRSRLDNVFPLTLGPHDSFLQDVLIAHRVFIRKLEVGMLMDIISLEYLVFAPTLGFLEDMLQPVDNIRFLRQNVSFGYPIYCILSKCYSNLDFNTMIKGNSY